MHQKKNNTETNTKKMWHYYDKQSVHIQYAAIIVSRKKGHKLHFVEITLQLCYNYRLLWVKMAEGKDEFFASPFEIFFK